MLIYFNVYLIYTLYYVLYIRTKYKCSKKYEKFLIKIGNAINAFITEFEKICFFTYFYKNS